MTSRDDDDEVIGPMPVAPMGNNDSDDEPDVGPMPARVESEDEIDPWPTFNDDVGPVATKRAHEEPHVADVVPQVKRKKRGSPTF
jgi:hypothetical protein